MTTHPYINKWYQFCPHCQTKLEAVDKNTTNCPQCEFTFYNNPAAAVAVLLIDEQGQVLLAKRKVSPKQGYWDNPGGFIDPEESVENTVTREMKEETGLEVEIITYLGSVADIYDLGPTINLVYLVRAVSGTLQPNDDVVELKWFKIDQIPWDQVAFANTKTAIELYQQYLNKGKVL